MAFLEALKPKPGSKHLSTIINAEGKLVQAETREDEQQKVKYQEIIELLLSAGYYRAKIKTLSQFDKVVGGMSWCIEICDMDLDVDILFQENSTIGQKIAVTEKIVGVLLGMDCPHSVEPHQIQGLDFAHIHPVVQWLVRRSQEERVERGDYLSQFAVHQFNAEYSFPWELPDLELVHSALNNIKTLQDKYGAVRKLRRVERKGEAGESLTTRVQSTLLEYGELPVNQDDWSEGEEQSTEIVDEAKLRSLTSNLQSVQPQEEVEVGKVRTMLRREAEEITEALTQYTTLQAQIQESGVKKLRREVEEASREKGELERRLEQSRERLEQVRRSVSSPHSVDHLSAHQQGELARVERLLLGGEALKEQELSFREQCKAEVDHLQNTIKECGLEGETETEEVEREVVEARLELGKSSRRVASLTRLLDQVPSRPELHQYQIRFFELYTTVSCKHRETKQYYTLYNSLNDTVHYLNKELSILHSILDNYNEAMASVGAREEFMKQFESIVDGVKHTKAKVEEKRREERENRQRERQRVQELVEEQREYQALVRQFTLECHHNQALLAAINQPH